MNLKALRQEKNITQKELARLSGVSRVVIARIEGNHMPDIRIGTFERLCRALNCTSDELLGGKKMFKYYSTMRPVSLGTYPKKGVEDIANYDEKTWVEAIQHNAWGELLYSRELSDDEMESYELAGGVKHDGN